jgi:hypothetical protein
MLRIDCGPHQCIPLLRLTACACTIALPSQCFLDQNELSRVLSSCSNLVPCRPAACHAKDSWLLTICRDLVLVLTKPKRLFCFPLVRFE